MLIQLLLGQIGGTCTQVAHETVQYLLQRWLVTVEISLVQGLP